MSNDDNKRVVASPTHWKAERQGVPRTRTSAKALREAVPPDARVLLDVRCARYLIGIVYETADGVVNVVSEATRVVCVVTDPTAAGTLFIRDRKHAHPVDTVRMLSIARGPRRVVQVSELTPR